MRNPGQSNFDVSLSSLYVCIHTQASVVQLPPEYMTAMSYADSLKIATQLADTFAPPQQVFAGTLKQPV